MSRDMIGSVGVVGLGAVGILYVQQFQRGLGVDGVQVIADPARAERYRRDGIVVNGEPLEFRLVCSDEATPVDLLVFATKYTGLAAAMESARGAVDPDTIVMSFLNGVSSEGDIAATLAPEHLLYSVVQGMDATKEGNALVYSHTGEVVFGERDGSASADVARVGELFERCGIAHTATDDILHAQWNKWMLNVGVNQVCGVREVGYAGVQAPGPLRDEMIAAMDEARAVAHAEGIELTAAERDAWVALVDTLAPSGEPSMRQDTKAGRPTEVELFSGVVCRLGRAHGIATPVNDALHEALVG